MKHKKVIGAAAISVTALLVIGVMAGFSLPKSSSSGLVDPSGINTISLEQQSLASTVNVTGMVYSKNATEVYSSLNYAVDTVNVEVGDYVSEGDVLAVLDSRSLQADIAQKQAAVGSASAKAQQSLSEAEKALKTYQDNADNGYNSSLVNAESSISSAELDVQTAELEMQAANNDLRTARRQLRDARDGEGDYEYEDPTDSQMDALKDAVYAKETLVEKTQINLEKAKERLEQAKTDLDVTKVSTDDNLSDYQDRVKSAQISTNFNDQWLYIQKLQEDLSRCSIISPVSGTVTAVNAVEGGSSSGLLFVIQDGDALKILANIKEYDIDNVNIGDTVMIKADATGDKEYKGTLTKISPTSNETKSGNTTTSTDSEYESEITVSSAQAGLKIGMNARLSIVTEEKNNIFAVPYEAVFEAEDGGSYIYSLVAAEKGKASVKMVPVEKGLQSNLSVEILGEKLTEGMQIVKNALSIDAAKVSPEIMQEAETVDDISEGEDSPSSETMEEN